MNTARPIPPLVENQSTDCELAELLASSGLSREDLAVAMGSLVSMSACWNPASVTLKAGLTVGTIKVGNLRIDVLPRMAADEMVTLIRYALGGSIDGHQRSQIATGRIGVDELICRVFAEELTALRQIGLSRKYINRAECLHVLRGRPDFVASFPWNERGMTSLACQYHELTCNNLDNQIIRAALERATLMETTVTTRQRLLEHRQAWSEISSLKPVGPSELVAARARYTRLSEHYRLAHNLSEVLLQAGSPSHLHSSGSTPTSGICLDMAALFEQFVERLLREYLEPHGLQVRSQHSDRGALLDRQGNRYRNVRPDVIVYRQTLPVAVIDAKYKDFWIAESGGTPVSRIGNDDLYQLFFYAQRLQLKYTLGTTPAAFIVSPLPALHERANHTVISERFTRVVWKAGSQSNCNLDLMLLPLTSLLMNCRSKGRLGLMHACRMSMDSLMREIGL